MKRREREGREREERRSTFAFAQNFPVQEIARKTERLATIATAAAGWRGDRWRGRRVVRRITESLIYPAGCRGGPW